MTSERQVFAPSEELSNNPFMQKVVIVQTINNPSVNTAKLLCFALLFQGGPVEKNPDKTYNKTS